MRAAYACSDGGSAGASSSSLPSCRPGKKELGHPFALRDIVRDEHRDGAAVYAKCSIAQRSIDPAAAPAWACEVDRLEVLKRRRSTQR